MSFAVLSLSPSAQPRAKTDTSNPFDFAKALHLFTSQVTQDLVDRQASTLYRMCRHHPNGFVRTNYNEF